MAIVLVKDSSATRDGDPTKGWARMADGYRRRKRPVWPGENIPKGGAHVLAARVTSGQLNDCVALAFQQHGQQSALRKGRGQFSHSVIFLFFLSEDDVI
jgi:hypothetical protein